MIQKIDDIKVDFRQKKSIGEQIYTQLLAVIHQKEMNSGDRLPTVRDLADRLGVNFNTVARVYRQLDREGLISTQHGRGTYILERDEQPEDRKDFSEEDFLQNLETFLQVEAGRSGQSPDTLWQLIWKQRNDEIRKERRRKPGPRKVTHKPGWKSFRNILKAGRSNRKKGNRRP